MPERTSRTISFFLPVLFALTNAAPVLAQVISDERTHAVRVTTGTVETRGWETTLLQGDPNLKHWHWNPVYSTVHGYKNIRQIEGPNNTTIIIKKGDGPPQPERPPVYIRPIKVLVKRREQPKPPPIIIQSPAKTPNDNPPGSNDDLSGRLMSKNINGALASKKVDASLASRRTSALLANKKVAAQLARRPQVATYDPYQTAPYYGSSMSSGHSEVHGRIASTYTHARCQPSRTEGASGLHF